MVTLQIDYKGLWSRIKAGELTAISLEGMFEFSTEPIDLCPEAKLFTSKVRRTNPG